MGTRSDHTLKEIESIRTGLGHKLDQLEDRFPFNGVGRKVGAVLGVLISSGALGTLWSFVVKRFKRSSEKPKARSKPAPIPEPIVVSVAPRGATAVAALGIAVWAGVRVYEAYTKSASGERGFRASVVKMPDERRSSGT